MQSEICHKFYIYEDDVQMLNYMFINEYVVSSGVELDFIV